VNHAIFGAALIHPGRETPAPCPWSIDRLADLLTIVDGLDANRRHIPSHASEITVRDTVGAHNLSLVRKIVLLNKYHSTQRHPFGFELLASPAAGSEGAKDKELLKKARRGTPFVPCCTPTLSFHSMETD
jgi:hypothetical protein